MHNTLRRSTLGPSAVVSHNRCSNQAVAASKLTGSSTTSATLVTPRSCAALGAPGAVTGSACAFGNK